MLAGTVGAITQAALPRLVLLGVFGVAALAVLARELGAVGFAVPERRRLVPEQVRLRGPEVGALQFGFEMGTGARTYSPSALPHLVLLAALTVLPFGDALTAAVGWAAGRLAMALVSNAYGPPGAWTAVWTRHRRWLAAVLAVAVVCALCRHLR